MGDSSDEEEEEMAETMKCVSCKEEYGSRNAGTCRECYEEASETEEELKREIEDLKSKVNFLRFFWGPPVFSPPLFTDVVLVASDDHSTASSQPIPVPAHRAVLVSFFGWFLDWSYNDSCSVYNFCCMKYVTFFCSRHD